MGDQHNLGWGVRPITIVWIAMLAALPIYVAAGLLAAPTLRPVLSVETFGLLRRVLYVAAAAILFLTGRVRRLVRGEEHPLPGPGGVPASPSPRADAAVIVSLAMCESVAVIGLVLYLLGGTRTEFFLLLGISAAAMVHYRPRTEERAD